MNYAAIKTYDIANGPGVRASLFVSGCRHHCKGCFNSEAWDFAYGQPFTKKEEDLLLSAVAPSYMEGLTLLGGEPFEPENQGPLADFAARFKELYPQKSLWCYTGFLLEDILAGRVGEKETALRLLSSLDVLVDGKFEAEKKSMGLLFRGSSNQRILDVKASLAKKEAVWQPGVWERKVGSNRIEED